MEHWETVIVIAVGTLFGTMLSGMIPWFVSQSPRMLLIFNFLGAGLLLGFSLTTIIPEGLVMLFESTLEDMPKSGDDFLVRDMHDVNKAGVLIENTVTAGMCLLAGFMLMMLVTEVEKSIEPKPESSEEKKEEIEVEMPEPGTKSPTDVVLKEAKPEGRSTVSLRTMFIAMCLDAIADGVLLGASSFLGGFSLVIFLGLVIHNFPQFFEFSSYMQHLARSRCEIIVYVVIGSLIAPLAMVLTFVILDSQEESSSMHFGVGVTLLIAGGVFIYIATLDVIPEVLGSENRETSMSEYIEEKKKMAKPIKISILFAGSIIPIILNAVVPHDHE